MERTILLGLLALTALVLVFNSVQIAEAKSTLGTTSEGASSELLPSGTPAIYGKELGVSFDAVSPNNPRAADATISKLAQLDRQIELTPAQNERYINALYKLHKGISCEYCCGARSIIFANGEAACGCAHSYAMRGLAKYLITEHGDEYTDREILEEVGKWKMLFFPTQIELKASILKEQGVEPSIVALTSNEYRGIEQGKTAGTMVGGC